MIEKLFGQVIPSKYIVLISWVVYKSFSKLIDTLTIYS